ncbi:uncharacterized protein EI90DRAFT_2046559 [Cantharellus anzutake]|uniref:uncharacterized protein n=1 Tax=Cantharellus anzutake TaxID=1750568 RepID=UPI001905894B|nr:uncharacterized protein EI90DRAFT_2046559 [Cantharellus anzutake]KAF8340297.1 hypothetical protein EI90DRAFT_2046559 [Cantharellus anzutake]
MPGGKKNIKKYLRPRLPGSRKVEGPGVWVTCIKVGLGPPQRQAVGEVYDIFESASMRCRSESSSLIKGISASREAISCFQRC